MIQSPIHTQPKIYGLHQQFLIFTAADGNYALQAMVLLLSLVKTQVSPTHLVIFGCNWSNRNRQRLMSLATSDVTVEIVEVDNSAFTDINLLSKFPLATAYNVIAPRYYIKNEGRALYLDADTVVLDDLGILWNTPMSTPVAAVVDAHIGWVASPSMWRPWREESLSPLAPYLNTGVMLIDLDAWRDSRMTERILHLLAKYHLPCADQDAINLSLKGSFDELPPKFNSMPYHLLTKLRNVDAVTDDDLIGVCISTPTILHFHRSFLGKPWTLGSIHPATNLWRALASEANPRWKRSTDFVGLLRRFAANQAKMLSLDIRSTDQSELIHKIY